jgi:hypothetical protein
MRNTRANNEKERKGLIAFSPMLEELSNLRDSALEVDDRHALALELD